VGDGHPGTGDGGLGDHAQIALRRLHALYEER
jgi:hypothetical protein